MRCYKTSIRGIVRCVIVRCIVEDGGWPAHLAVFLAAPNHSAVMIQELNDPIRKVDTTALGCRPEVPAHTSVHISKGVHGASGGKACNMMARAY